MLVEKGALLLNSNSVSAGPISNRRPLFDSASQAVQGSGVQSNSFGVSDEQRSTEAMASQEDARIAAAQIARATGNSSQAVQIAGTQNDCVQHTAR